MPSRRSFNILGKIPSRKTSSHRIVFVACGPRHRNVSGFSYPSDAPARDCQTSPPHPIMKPNITNDLTQANRTPYGE